MTINPASKRALPWSAHRLPSSLQSASSDPNSWLSEVLRGNDGDSEANRVQALRRQTLTLLRRMRQAGTPEQGHDVTHEAVQHIQVTAFLPLCAELSADLHVDLWSRTTDDDVRLATTNDALYEALSSYTQEFSSKLSLAWSHPVTVRIEFGQALPEDEI